MISLLAPVYFAYFHAHLIVKHFELDREVVSIETMMRSPTLHAALIILMSAQTNQWIPVNLSVDWIQFIIIWDVRIILDS